MRMRAKVVGKYCSIDDDYGLMCADRLCLQSRGDSNCKRLLSFVVGQIGSPYKYQQCAQHSSMHNLQLQGRKMQGTLQVGTPPGKVKNSVGKFWNWHPRVEFAGVFLQRFVTPNLYITQIPHISDLFFYLIPVTTGAVSII